MHQFPKMKVLCLLVFLLIPSVSFAREPVILLGVDGFRWDYLSMIETPHIDRMIQRGFQAQRLIPSYPSFTFPNMYTLVTGNHPARHGVTGSKTFDEATGKYFNRKNHEDNEDPQWFQSTPIWTTARNQGVKTGVFHWVGSLVKGREPDLLAPFKLEDLTTYYEKRITKFRKWLSLPQPPELLLAYLFPLDKAGHDHGPGSSQMLEGMKELDRFVGDLTAMLEDLGLNPNIVFVSDHGMLSLKQGGTLVSEVHEALEGEPVLKVINQYTRMQIFLKDSSPENIERVIKKLPTFSHLRWMTRDQNPYPVHPTRDGHIIGEMEPPYEFMKNRDPDMGGYKGVHGYGPHVPEMAAACFGVGPAFKPGSKLDEVRAVDVFPLILQLLDLPQQSVDGSLGVWKPILLEQGGGSEHSE